MYLKYGVGPQNSQYRKVVLVVVDQPFSLRNAFSIPFKNIDENKYHVKRQTTKNEGKIGSFWKTFFSKK
jgi:hypothetical protein